MSIELKNLQKTSAEHKEEEACAKKEEKTREFLDSQYDPEKKEHKRYASKDDFVNAMYGEYHQDEIRNKFKEDEIEIKKARVEINELSSELESSNSMTEDQIEGRKEDVKAWKKKWNKDRIDDVTGLRIRKVLFEMMNKKIKEIYSFDDKTTKEEIFEALITKDINELDNANFSVMMADVSFLSLVNDSGHEQGDELLAKISAEVKREIGKSFRHGGDEITGFFDEATGVIDMSDGDIKGKIEKMKESVRNISIEKMKNYKLKPNLDVGVANFSEALTVFRELAKNSECREKLKDNPVKKIENIIVAIADKRSFLEKGKERIFLLTEKYEDKKVYNEIISFLRKGGHGISDKKVEQIANLAKGNMSTRIVNFIKKLTTGEEYKPGEREKKSVKKAINNAIAKFISEKEKIELEKKSKSENKYSYFESKAIMKVVESN